MSYELALATTLLAEVPMAAALAGSGRRRIVAVTALLLNLVSHPLGYLALLHLVAPFALVESLVIAFETAGFRIVAGLSWTRALAISCLANGVTLGLSLIL